MAQISFFPYMFLSSTELIKYDGVIVWNFDYQRNNRILDKELRSYISKLLRANTIFGKAINGIGIISFNDDYQTFEEFTEEEQNRIEEARKVFFLCAIANTNLRDGPFSCHGMVTTENFMRITQNFVPNSNYTGYQTGLIVSTLDGGYKVGEIKFEAPRDLVKNSVRMDEELLRSFEELKSMNINEYNRILAATDPLMDSYYNTHVVSVPSRILLQTRAFEILFQLPQNKQRKKFKEKIDHYCRLQSEKNVGFKSLRMNGKLEIEEGTCQKAWAEDFYSLRNKIVHGDQVKREDYKFFKQFHFNLALWFFIVTVKQLMNEIFNKTVFDDAIRWEYDRFVYDKHPSERRLKKLQYELIWLTVVKRENISCPTGIQRFLAVG